MSFEFFVCVCYFLAYIMYLQIHLLLLTFIDVSFISLPFDCIRTWCKYLKSVEYIGFADGEKEYLTSDSINIPLRESRWTVSVKGLRFR